MACGGTCFRPGLRSTTRSKHWFWAITLWFTPLRRRDWSFPVTPAFRERWLQRNTLTLLHVSVWLTHQVSRAVCCTRSSVRTRPAYVRDGACFTPPSRGSRRGL